VSCIVKQSFGLLLAFASCTVLAALEEGGKLAPEPTVGIGWVFFFLILFVGICAGIGIAIWRAEKKSRAEGNGDKA
jgi:Na+-transporting methylmalonyl-CoA/oxaloacetate decarboxylase gamma subunit